MRASHPLEKRSISIFWSVELKKMFLLLFLLFSHFVPCLSAQPVDKIVSPSGVEVEFFPATLEPGDVVVVRIAHPANIQEAYLSMNESRYPMGQGRRGFGLYAFVGISMEIEPGLYELKVFLKKDTGRWERVEGFISVLPRKYRVARLWVEERFLVPPLEFRDRIEWEARILRALYEIRNPRWLGDGRFIPPVEGRISAGFGERRIYNDSHRSTHRGVDISGPPGRPVKAANSGNVVLASDLYYAGKTVIIDHGLGVYTLYCHFSKIRVRTGTWVSKGQVIGEIGASGRVTGPHLHWSAKMSGTDVDPISLLSLELD